MELQNNSQLRRNVMRRVRIMHVARPFISSMTLAVILFATSLYILGREVWVARVLQNMPSPAHTLALAQFFLSAFVNTRTVVQLCIVLSAAAFIWLARDIARSFSYTLRFA